LKTKEAGDSGDTSVKRAEDGTFAPRGEVTWVEFKAVEDNLPFSPPMKALDSKAAEAKIIEDKTVEMKPVEMKAVEMKPAEKTIEAKPADASLIKDSNVEIEKKAKLFMIEKSNDVPPAAAQPVDGGGH